MTRVTYCPEEYRLRVEGHAGAGAVGEDIVCAAASILLWTLVDAAQEFQMHLYTNDGIAEVNCYPDEEQEEKCRFLFDTIWNGYGMLGENYPEHIMTGG